jgi:hypothetical protein
MQNALVDDWLFFDPTDQYLQIGQISSNLQGRSVVLGAHLDSVIYRLPSPDPKKFRQHYKLNGKIEENGNVTAEISIKSYGGWASQDRYNTRILTKEELMQRCYIKLSETIPDFKILEYNTYDYPDSFVTVYKISGNDLIQRTGGFYLLRPDIFEPWVPILFDESQRNFPVWFGPPGEVTKSISWDYPSKWKARIGEHSILHNCLGGSIIMECVDKGNQVNLECTYLQHGKLVPVDQYDDAIEFARQLSKVDGKTIIFSKN